MRQSIVSLGSSLRSFQFSSSFLPSSSFRLVLSATYYLPVGEDPPLFSSRDAKSSVSNPMAYLGDGNGQDFLFPLVWRGWQFRGVSHRGAASRTNKSLEERDRVERGWMGPRRLQAGRETCDPPLVTRIDHPV